MKERKKEGKKLSKGKVFVFLVILIAVVAVAIYFGTKSADDTSKTVANNDNKQNEEVKEPEEEEDGYDESITYANEYEEAVLKRTRKNNDYKIIEINEPKCHGYLTVIYEPSRIHVTATSKVGQEGEWLVDMPEAKKAMVAINGGGFADENFEGSGGTPLGITISKGNYITKSSYSGSYGIIGFDRNDKLVLGKYSLDLTESMGIRDAVTFGPFLILDGQAVKDTGSSAKGRAARTAIAQRADGIVMFLVLDGDRTKGEGAIYSEEIEILQRYGAVNAANLDGGTSTCMTVNGTLVNDPTSMNGEHRTREISTAFILEADGSDNSDHSVVQGKLN